MMDVKQQSKFVGGIKIGFFFGSGASIEFGVPSMRRMTEDFRREILKKGKPDEKVLFSNVYDSLVQFYGENGIDLEAIMSVIISLKEKEHIRENIGDFGLFISNKKVIENANKILKEISIKTVTRLDNKFKSHIRSEVKIRKGGYDKVEKVYDNFFDEVCRIAGCGNERSYDKWVFFTTNYDTALEHYWTKHIKYKHLDLGFDSNNIMKADDLIAHYMANNFSAMQLIKLHGSINWTREKNGDIIQHEFGLDVDGVARHTSSSKQPSDIMIYPLTQKELYRTPFIQFFRVLEADLNKRQYWIVIGYSFRDIVIRRMFEKSLQEDPKRRIILVHPRPELVTVLFLENLRKQIIPVGQYFARNEDYKEVNKKIVDIIV